MTDLFCPRCKQVLRPRDIRTGATECSRLADCNKRRLKHEQAIVKQNAKRRQRAQKQLGGSALSAPKRGERPRKRLRRVSKTNSKKHEDLVFRAHYMQDKRICELVRLFPVHRRGWHLVPNSESGDGEVFPLHEPAAHAHHIASVVMRTPRWDKPWNLIATCAAAHSFVHRWTSDGLVLCLRAKQLNLMLDYAELSRVTRVSFPSYLETLTLRWDWCEVVREKLLERAMR